MLESLKDLLAKAEENGIEAGVVTLNIAVMLVIYYGLRNFIPAVDNLPMMVGTLCGAVTNTPMLGAGQQALLQVAPHDIEGANRMAMACAVAYPFGLVGLIITIIFLRKILAPKNAAPAHDPSSDNTFIAEYCISNPAIFGKTIMSIRKNADCHFVISRIWKDGKVIVPTSETVIEENEHLLIISGKIQPFPDIVIVCHGHTLR